MTINILLMNGRLAATPEETKIGDRTKTKFRMANKRKYKSQGELKEVTTWVDVECWGPLADNVVKYCIKGQEVLVRGRLEIEAWQDKEGNNRWSTKISASDVIFGNKPRDATENTVSSPGISKETLVQMVESVNALVEKGVTPPVAAALMLENLNKK